ncbi:PAS domain S-box-containing protein [Cytobacillus firmus]|uniref:histidine kinase n=2 Tax=Cytobacillus TaxID=2675230 RepID=A0A366JHV9_CYTFI|nr:PAS domain S-box-containing protein [Cytobacillus firmus]TDX35469.1 PAS domain S-box-containing protein [Cytobacillus oceanisediminis]
MTGEIFLKKLLQSRITKRYVFMTFIVVFGSLASIYFVTMNVLNDSVRSEIEYRNELLSKTISTKTSFMFDKMINDIRVISEFVLSNSKENTYFYQNEMERLVSENPLYLFIDVLDESGNSITTIPNVKKSAPEDVNKILERLKWAKTFYISNLLTLDDGRKTIGIAFPVLDDGGQYQGAILAYVNLNILSEYLSEGKIGSKGQNILIDRNQTIIAHTKEQLIGETLKDHELGQMLSNYRIGIWEGLLFKEFMLASYRPITLGGLGLIICESVDQAMEPARQVQVLLFKGFIIVVFLTYLLTLFGAFRFIKPITNLTNQAKEYSDGKRTDFELLHTGDELENLTKTMASMALELKNKERHLFYILESIPYGIITINKDGRIVTFNKGAEELSGFSRTEAIGKYIIDLPLKKNEADFLSWRTIKEGKEINEQESYIYDKDGRKHDVRIYSSLFSGEDQNILGSILILRDVSDMKKMEEYLKQSEKLASLGQMTAGIAHEIKNPLSIIQAAAEAIQLDTQDPSFIQEMTEDILETTDRLNQLLTDFLNLSRGESEDELEKVDLAAVLDELLGLLKNNFAEQNITVSKFFTAEEAFVLATAGKLSQVFLNIIINSLHAMDKGGQLTVRILDNDSDWLVEIKDNGLGIPESEIKWIFNPFFTTKKEGTGLGLSIAYEITTQLGGTIQANSDISGTVLRVQLPKFNEERWA